jgi:hypothetical protein
MIKVTRLKTKKNRPKGEYLTLVKKLGNFMKILLVGLMILGSLSAQATNDCKATNIEDESFVQELTNAFDQHDKKSAYHLVRDALNNHSYYEYHSPGVEIYFPCKYYFAIRSIYEGWNDLKEYIIASTIGHANIFELSHVTIGDLLLRINSPYDIDKYKTRRDNVNYEGDYYSDLNISYHTYSLIELFSTNHNNDAIAINKLFDREGYPKKKMEESKKNIDLKYLKSSDSWAVVKDRLIRATVTSTSSNSTNISISQYIDMKLDQSFGTNGYLQLNIKGGVQKTSLLTFEQDGFFYLAVCPGMYLNIAVPEKKNRFFKVSLNGKEWKEADITNNPYLSSNKSIYKIHFDGENTPFIQASFYVGEVRSNVLNNQIQIDRDLNVKRIDELVYRVDFINREPRKTERVDSFLGRNNQIAMLFDADGMNSPYKANWTMIDLFTGKPIFSQPENCLFPKIIAEVDSKYLFICNDSLFQYDLLEGISIKLMDVPEYLRPILSDHRNLNFYNSDRHIYMAFKKEFNTRAPYVLYKLDFNLQMVQEYNLSEDINITGVTPNARPTAAGLYLENMKRRSLIGPSPYLDTVAWEYIYDEKSDYIYPNNTVIKY